MRNDVELLRAEIDVLRRTLHEIAIGKKLSDNEVVAASVNLDKVLNLYQRAYGTVRRQGRAEVRSAGVAFTLDGLRSRIQEN